MIIENNFSLKALNTFCIEAKAQHYAAFSSIEELKEALREAEQINRPTYILGGGSNILFTKDIDALVLHNRIMGMEVIKEDRHHVYVKAGAGELWHDFVTFALLHNLAGTENLSLIPGTVGAAPMQNIGAYGVEQKEIFFSLDAVNRDTQEVKNFSLLDCKFGYRESIFKNALKGQYIICHVIYRLNKDAALNTSYGAIQQELEHLGIKNPSIKDISEAVCNIRRSKLPDPAEIGNAGSFFKNPVVTEEKFAALQKDNPDLVGYALDDESVKLAAGWLIEKCGWKGYRKGDAGCHAKQALVLVNYGEATGEEIYNLSQMIIDDVDEKFDVVLSREVNVI